MSDIKQYEPLWGSWYVDSLIGEGSFGKVYKVRREEFGKTYYAAVKIITIPQNESDLRHIRSEGLDEASVRSYFQAFVADIIQEIDLMSAFKGNSNIVSFEDHKVIERPDGIGWDILIRMELLTSLSNYVNEKPLSQEEIIKLGIHICRALELCAVKKTIHRDIKPDNIFVSEYGEYKLGDFGIARQIERTSSGLSKKGTYTYMAPEVFKGDEYGSSVDTYSLGIVMYRFLNQNRTPFLPDFPAPITPRDRDESLNRRMKGESLPLIQGVEPSLNTIILKACAHDRKARYSSPTEMREALETVAGGKGYAPVPTPVYSAAVDERTSDGTAGIFGSSVIESKRAEDITSATEGIFAGSPKPAPYSPYHEATSRTEGVFDAPPAKSEYSEIKPAAKKNKIVPIFFAASVAGILLIFIASQLLHDNSLVTEPEDFTDEVGLVEDVSLVEADSTITQEDTDSASTQSTSQSSERYQIEIEGQLIWSDVVELDLSHRNISDITPLQSLMYLTKLYLTDNQISDITPLQSLTNLTGIDLTGNQIIDITPLQSLTNLTELYLTGNQISDVTPLQSLTNLTRLQLSDNQINDTTPLQSLTNLTDIELQSNPINDITPLQSLTTLTKLSLFDNQINDIAPLKSLINLKVLYLYRNPISDAQIIELRKALPDCRIGFNVGF